MVFMRTVLLVSVLVTFGSYTSGRVVPTDMEDEAFIKDEGSSMTNPGYMAVEGEIDSVKLNNVDYPRLENTETKVSHDNIKLNNINHGTEQRVQPAPCPMGYMKMYGKCVKIFPDLESDVDYEEECETSDSSNLGKRRCPIRVPCPEGYIRIHGKCYKMDPDLASDVDYEEECKTSESGNLGKRRCPIRVPCPKGYIRIHGKCYKMDPDLENGANFDDEGENINSVNHGKEQRVQPAPCPMGYMKFYGKCVKIYPDLENNDNFGEEDETSEYSNRGMRRCPIRVPCPKGYIRIRGKCVKIDPDLQDNVDFDDEGVEIVGDECVESDQQGHGGEEYDRMVSNVDVSSFEHTISRKYLPQLRSIIHEIPCNGKEYMKYKGRCFKIVIDGEDIEEIKKEVAQAFAKIADLIRCAAEGGKMVGEECVKSNSQGNDKEDYDQMLSYVDMSNFKPTSSRKYRPESRSILNKVPCNGDDYIKFHGHCYKIVIDEEDIEEMKKGADEAIAKLAAFVQCAVEGGKMVGDKCVKSIQIHDESYDQEINYVDISNFKPTISRKYRPESRSILNKVPCNGDDYIRFHGHCYKIIIDEEDIEEIKKEADEAIAKLAAFIQCAVEGGRMVLDKCVKSNQIHDESYDQEISYVDINNFKPTISHKYRPESRSILNKVPCNGNDLIKIKDRCYKIVIDDEDIEDARKWITEVFAKIAEIIQCAAEGGEMVGDECVRPSQEDYKQTFSSIFPDFCQPGYKKIAGKCRKVYPIDEDKETKAHVVENHLNGVQGSEITGELHNGTKLKHIFDVECQEGYVKINGKCREIVD